MTRRDAKTLLIADDDHDLVSVLSMRCRRLGLKVLTAFDAFTALSMVRSKMPDLVCLDVGMPGGNGLSVCEMISSDATFREIPVIVLTGRSDPHTICRCHSMCAYYVEKSTDTWTRLEPLIRELLEIPGTLPADAGHKPEAERKPAPIFPSLSALYTEDIVDKPIATSEASIAEPAASSVPPESTASHPDPTGSGAAAVDSSERESEEPCSLPDWETWTADPAEERIRPPKLLAECPPAGNVEELAKLEAPERHSDELVSKDGSEAPSETEAPVEPSSVWRHLAQVMGRVVGRTAEETGNATEETAFQSDVSEGNFQHESVSPVWHDSLKLSVESKPPAESTLAVESTPNDLRANEPDRLQTPLPRELEEKSDSGPSTVGSAHEAVPLVELDQVWSLTANAAGASGSTNIYSDQVAKSVPAERPEKQTKAKKPGVAQEKTLLIADDDCDLVQMLVLRCTQLGLNVFRSPDAMHALLGAHRVQPDLVILDVNMPGGNGLSVCEMMTGDPALARIPVIVMTGDTNEEIPRRCQALHAQFLQKGSGLWERLEPLIRKSLGMPPAIAPKAAAPTHSRARDANQPPRILCIDDDPEISKILKMRLEPYGVDVLRAFKGMQGYWTALDMRPDLIILDMVMPDGGGNYIMGRLRAHPLTEKIPVLMLTGINTPGVRRQMFGMGVDAYLTKPLNFDDLIEHVGQYVTLRDRNCSPVAR